MATHAEVQDIIHYHFNRLELLEEATLAAGASVSRQDVDGGVQGNKPLALIGDSLIRLDVAVRSYARGDSAGKRKHPRHDFTLLSRVDESAQILATVGSNKNLEALGKRLGVDGSVTKNPCQKGGIPRTTLASTVEGLIGAIWVDSENNFALVQGVIRALGITEPFESTCS